MIKKCWICGDPITDEKPIELKEVSFGKGVIIHHVCVRCKIEINSGRYFSQSKLY